MSALLCDRGPLAGVEPSPDPPRFRGGECVGEAQLAHRALGAHGAALVDLLVGRIDEIEVEAPAARCTFAP